MSSTSRLKCSRINAPRAAASRLQKLVRFSAAASLMLFASVYASWAQSFPGSLREGRNSARSPTVASNVVTFTIMPGDCQSRTYGDGRGESDCGNLNSKSYLAAGDVPSGSTMLYAFDVRIAGGLTHAAFRNPDAVPFTGGLDSRLTVALWQGELIKNHLYSLDLDRTRGLTFLGQRCAAPGGLADWTRFQMIVRWSAGSDGLMQVSCNDHIVYAVSGRPTDRAPHCFASNHCEPGKVKHPTRINTGFGIFFDKEVVNGVPTRPRVPASGLSIQMRNFKIGPVRLK